MIMYLRKTNSIYERGVRKYQRLCRHWGQWRSRGRRGFTCWSWEAPAACDEDNGEVGCPWTSQAEHIETSSLWRILEQNMLKQFMKNCGSLEGLTMKKFVEDCPPKCGTPCWSRGRVGEGRSSRDNADCNSYSMFPCETFGERLEKFGVKSSLGRSRGKGVFKICSYFSLFNSDLHGNKRN